jgi:hypothetical protein
MRPPAPDPARDPASSRPAEDASGSPTWERVKALFQAALDLPAERRQSFLEAEAGDPAILREVLKLLASVRDDDFLEDPGIAMLQALAGEPDNEAVESDSSDITRSPLDAPYHDSPSDPLVAGEPLLDGKYLLEQYLAGGGMGVVYRARHVGLNRIVAVKLIQSEARRNEAFLARFRIEAAALGRLKHPCIVDVTDFGVDARDGGLPYLVMEYL